MARPSSSAQQRPLSLTEELEKVEQQITLTLQEIDRNFSHAHRVVTSSILPIVEQYAAHSRHVWDGSRFWKQFFESSANVSLSGYEEDASLQPDQLDETTMTTATASTATDSVTDASPNPPSHSTLETSESYSTPSAHQLSTSSVADLDISNLSLSPSKSSTPRPPRQQRARAADHTTTFADYPSPYEALHDEVSTSTKQKQKQDENKTAAPTTPGRQQTLLGLGDIAMTPQSPSSPFLPPAPTSIPRPSATRQKTDPLLYRVLDRNYRIQATPLTTRRHASPVKSAHRLAHHAAATTPAPSKQRAVPDAAFSSSPIAPPELHEELFSPARKPPAPGVSVLAAVPQKQSQRAGATALTARQPPQFWDDSDDDDDDDDDGLGYEASPPKTMQFHVPQSRLLKTPAREASRQMVQDILTSAGVGRDDDEDDLELDMDMTDYGDPPFEADEEASPSVVRKAVGLEDETF